jgi:hypothetical protein
MSNLSNKKSVLHLVTKNASCSSRLMHGKALSKAALQLGWQHRLPRQNRGHRQDCRHLAPCRQKQAGNRRDIAAKECRGLNATLDEITGKDKINSLQPTPSDMQNEDAYLN